MTTRDGSTGLLVVSRQLALLDLATGALVDSYPDGAARDLRRRFMESMMEGERTFTEAEKIAALEREAFPIAGPLFGPALHTGGGIAFGTEEGWVYFFHAASLRPTFRYLAGRPAAGLPRPLGDRLLAAAGNEVFALSLASGEVLWQRGVGGKVRELTGGETLVVLAGERLSTLDAKDGSRGWTQGRGVRFVSAEREPWLVADAQGRLQVLGPAGQKLAELPPQGVLLRPVSVGSDAWVSATAEGRVFGVRFAAGRLEQVWEHELGERIRDLQAAGARLLVRLESGALVGLEPGTGRRTWQLRLAASERVALSNDDHALIVYGGDTLRIYDLLVGRITFARAARAEAVGVALDGTKLSWLDRVGFAHTVDIRDGKTIRQSDLGVQFEAATRGGGGFLVRTAAGEIGVVVESGRGTVPASRDRQEP